MGKPSVHPTGTIIYKPEKCFNGYTLFPAATHGAMLIDMNGGVVNCWPDVQGFPPKLLKGGQVLGSSGERDCRFAHQDQLDLIQVDWDGNVVWSFDKLEYIEDPENEPRWMARQHHDYQREGNPTGYYVPDMECKTDSGNTLLLCHHEVVDYRISSYTLLDDIIIEVDWEGNIVWQWKCHEHFDEFGFDEVAKNTMFKYPAFADVGGFDSHAKGDWMHLNSMSLVGPNKWYDQGDERFNPNNIIVDGRETNIIFIISKETGKVVWQLGPDYTKSPAKEIGQIVGQHHAHIIPKGLPGEGNVLVYDNGGWAGYGAPNPGAPTGSRNGRRDYSRVLEINPVEMKIEWQCTPNELGAIVPFHADHFYSPFISSAQRLPNGNTLITEGSDGRLFEVTADHEIVWEYISPYVGEKRPSSVTLPINMAYRGYRYPYDYVPQVEKPEEVAIKPIDNNDFRLEGAKGKELTRVTKLQK